MPESDANAQAHTNCTVRIIRFMVSARVEQWCRTKTDSLYIYIYMLIWPLDQWKHDKCMAAGFVCNGSPSIMNGWFLLVCEEAPWVFKLSHYLYYSRKSGNKWWLFINLCGYDGRSVCSVHPTGCSGCLIADHTQLTISTGAIKNVCTTNVYGNALISGARTYHGSMSIGTHIFAHVCMYQTRTDPDRCQASRWWWWWWCAKHKYV